MLEDSYVKMFRTRYQEDQFVTSPYEDELEWLTPNMVYWIRVIMLIMNTVQFQFPWLIKTNIGMMLVYLSFWGVWLTELSLFFSIWASEYEQGVNSIVDYKVMAVLINSLGENVNIIVTIVSWIFILPLLWTMDDGWSTPAMVYFQLDNIFIHLLPFIYTTINMFLLSDMTVKYSDYWMIPIVSGTYLSITYVWTKKSG